MEKPVILCGLGKVGWRVFEFLRATGIKVAVIDQNAEASDPRLAGSVFVKGDCRVPGLLETAGIASARGVIIVTSDDLVNISAALLARRLNPECRIVVRMFNQNLIPRFGTAVKNMSALSVSALTAPLLALTAVTGDSLGAFKLESGPQQIVEIEVPEGSDLVGKTLAQVADLHHLQVLGHKPANGDQRLLNAVASDTALSPGDRFTACGKPADLEPLLAAGRGDLLPGVRWAGFLRRQWRTVRRTLGAIDLPVKLGTSALFLTLFASTLVFRFGAGTTWADGLYQTVSVIATGSDLHGEGQDAWIKAFLSVLKVAGAALMAAFTAIFTQYLLRAKLGGALEARKIPDGGHVVVCGIGNVGFRCVEELVRLGTPVVAVEKVNDNPFAATVRRMGVPVIIGDSTVPEVLRQARADSARSVLATTSSELANLEIALLAREMNPTQRVIVRLNDPDFAQAVREAASIRFAVSVPSLAAPAIAAALYGDRIHTLITVGEKLLAIVELVVQGNDTGLGNRKLSEAVADFRFQPVGPVIPDRLLAAGDRLTVVVELPDLERLLRRDATKSG